jgi:hypothetical protein
MNTYRKYNPSVKNPCEKNPTFVSVGASTVVPFDKVLDADVL